jgi:hypothetical protein
MIIGFKESCLLEYYAVEDRSSSAFRVEALVASSSFAAGLVYSLTAKVEQNLPLKHRYISRRNIPKGTTLHCRGFKNLRPHIFIFFLVLCYVFSGLI